MINTYTGTLPVVNEDEVVALVISVSKTENNMALTSIIQHM